MARSSQQCGRAVMDKSLFLPTAESVRRLRSLQTALTKVQRGEAAGIPPPHHWVGLDRVPALDRAAKRFCRRHDEVEFPRRVLLPVVRAALEFDELFSDDDSVSSVGVSPRHAVYSRRQLYCIVANAFLCTFMERPEDTIDSLPSINYTEMHTAPKGENEVEVAKLEMLLEYFLKMASQRRSATLLKDIEVFRNSVEGLPVKRDVPCLPPTVHALGESIDDQHRMLRLDFANRWIGGGALSDGCVQEEIIFAQCPELNALRWIHGPMEDSESIVVRGYRQYSFIKAGTYGSLTRYGGALPTARKMGGALVAVDAVDYRFEDTAAQFTPTAVRRELVKLMSALSIPALDDYKKVAGGNWGCGVFGGDYELKFLVQWLACSWCGKTLCYFPFNNPAFVHVEKITSVLCRRGITTAALFEFLMCLPPEGTGSVWSHLVVWFQQRCGPLV